MTVTQASLNALAAHTRKRSDTVRARIEKALRELRKQNADITVSSVARRAGVTRKSIYQRHDLVALIRAHRPVATVPDDKPPPPDTETSIVAALRARLTAKDTQIAQLKKSNPARPRPHNRRPARRTRTNRRHRSITAPSHHDPRSLLAAGAQTMV